MFSNAHRTDFGRLAVVLALAGHGRFTVTAAIVLGLVWIAIARTTGDGSTSQPAAIAALAAAALAIVATAIARLPAHVPASPPSRNPESCAVLGRSTTSDP